MERSELPLSWRDRSALTHMLSGGAKVDHAFPAGVGRPTLDGVEARGWAWKMPHPDGGFMFTITDEGRRVLEADDYFRGLGPAPRHVTPRASEGRDHSTGINNAG
jgi:hypothetical protein